MNLTPDSFTILEYLSVFTAFVYGYVATRFFSGWGAMVNYRQHIQFSKEHLLWTVLTFGLLIDVWWGSWIKGSFIRNHITLYYLSLLPPLVFYLISVLLFPPFSEERFMDLKRHFNSVRRRNYVIYIGLFLSFLIGDYFFKRPIISNYYFNTVAIAFAVLGYVKNESTTIQRFILFLGWGILVLHIFKQPEIWNVNIDRFSMTEYLTIFIAFVYGSVASRILTGWGIMISKYDRINFSRDHLAWTVLVFGLLIDFWIGSWPREKFIGININYFILSLLVPVTYYGLTAVLFPNIKNGNTIDLVQFFTTHKKIIYLLFGATMIANTITANFMEQKLMEVENVFRLIAIALATLAYMTRQILVERMLLVIGWITLILHIVVDSLQQA